jgi:hypothetical protein
LFFTLFVLIFTCRQKSIWSVNNNINIFVQNNSDYIYSYSPSTDVLNIIKLPENFFLPTAKGYGEYPLKNIYQLGEEENIGGGLLLQKSLQNFFLVPIDGFFINESEKFFQFSQSEKEALSKLLLPLVKGKVDTNFCWRDIIRLINNLRRLNISNINVISLQNTNLYREEKLADGTTAVKLEPSLIDEFVQKYFTNPKILQEGLKISVYNATNSPGLADKAGRLIKNIGGEIIISENADQQTSSSIVYCNSKEVQKSHTVEKMSSILQIFKIELKEDITGDIGIVLGQDYLNNFYAN